MRNFPILWGIFKKYIYKRGSFDNRRADVDNSGPRVALRRHNVQTVQILPDIRADQLHLPGGGHSSGQALGHRHPAIQVTLFPFVSFSCFSLETNQAWIVCPKIVGALARKSI